MFFKHLFAYFRYFHHTLLTSFYLSRWKKNRCIPKKYSSLFFSSFHLHNDWFSVGMTVCISDFTVNFFDHDNEVILFFLNINSIYIGTSWEKKCFKQFYETQMVGVDKWCHINCFCTFKNILIFDIHQTEWKIHLILVKFVRNKYTKMMLAKIIIV